MKIAIASSWLLATMLSVVQAASDQHLSSPFQDTSTHKSRYQALLQPLNSARSSWSRLAGNVKAQSAVSPSATSTSTSSAFLDNLVRHWKQADSTKQTFMALFLIIQIIVLLFAIKGSLDKLFGRRAEYRNRRTRRFARRAAVAAAGGLVKASIPPSHHRALYRPLDKPQLPPRPTASHPVMQSHDKAQFNTNQSGEIVLPSWTEQGPTSLNVIIEEPEREQIEQELSYLTRKDSFSQPGESPQSWRDALGGASRPDSPSNYFSLNHPWSLRSSLFANQASLRLRERNECSMLPFSIDRSSTPDTRLEDVKRPVTRPSYPDWRVHPLEQGSPDLESLASVKHSAS